MSNECDACIGGKDLDETANAKLVDITITVSFKGESVSESRGVWFLKPASLTGIRDAVFRRIQYIGTEYDRTGR